MIYYIAKSVGFAYPNSVREATDCKLIGATLVAVGDLALLIDYNCVLENSCVLQYISVFVRNLQ